MQAFTGITDTLSRYAGQALALGAISLLAVLLAASPAGWYLDRVVYDDNVVRLNRAPVPEDVVIVALDDITFDVMADEMDGLVWPYPRSFHAAVLEHLADAGAKAVFLDIILDLESGFGPDDDAVLKTALGRIPTVLAGEYAPGTVIGPLPGLVDAGGIPANVTIPLDVDHKARFMKAADPFPRSFAEAVRYYTGNLLPGFFSSGSGMARTGRDESDSVPSVEQALARLASRTNALPAPGFIHFYGPAGSFETLSYFEVVNKDLFADHAHRFTDRVVFVGRTIRASVTPDEQPDVFAVPYGNTMMAGVEIHANAYASLIHGQTRYRAASRVMLPAMILWFVLTFLVLNRISSPWTGFLSTAGSLGGLKLCNYFLYMHHLVWMVSPFAFFTVICYGTSLVRHYVKERDRRLFTQAQLFHYLPGRVAAHVLRHPQKLAMAGDRKQITLLFGDIAGFTTLSETHAPEVIIPLLQEHLRDMTQAIFDHDGTLDKYIGDGIMAFWGAPEDQENHADLALAAAVAMLVSLDQANRKRQAGGRDGLHLRIGLHTGEAVVGNIGSDLFIDYTAIGDNVNTASRIEGAGKYFGTRLTISGECLAALTGNPGVPVTRLGNVAVKGRKTPVALFTVADDMTAPAHRALVPFFDCMDSGQFDKARICLGTVLEVYPDFGPALFHQARFQSDNRPLLSDGHLWYWQLEGK